VIRGCAGRAGLTELASEDLTDSYPLTLRAWRSRFLGADLPGYDERFRRMWELYLCWAEGGFLERRTEDHQLLFAASAFEHARRQRVEQERRAA
jgi:cyclopropane-fatty-acyl-phospholipid synthase